MVFARGGAGAPHPPLLRNFNWKISASACTYWKRSDDGSEGRRGTGDGGREAGGGRRVRQIGSERERERERRRWRRREGGACRCALMLGRKGGQSWSSTF
jgi:hypothetical protein